MLAVEEKSPTRNHNENLFSSLSVYPEPLKNDVFHSNSFLRQP